MRIVAAYVTLLSDIIHALSRVPRLKRIRNPANAPAGRIVARSPYRAPNLYYEITRRGKSAGKCLRCWAYRNVNRANQSEVSALPFPCQSGFLLYFMRSDASATIRHN